MRTRRPCQLSVRATLAEGSAQLDQHGVARIDAPEQPLEILARRVVQPLARRAASVLDQQATIATVCGVARRTLDARVGRDPGEDELLDPPRAQQPLETR